MRSNVISVRVMLKELGTSWSKEKSNKNFDAVVAGWELGYLSKEDVLYMLKEDTTVNMAQNRLVQRRHDTDED